MEAADSAAGSMEVEDSVVGSMKVAEHSAAANTAADLVVDSAVGSVEGTGAA